MPVDAAVILMAYGSPRGPEEVAAYLAHIRGGEAPSHEMVEDLRRRYDAIGGRSPLLDITRAQARELEALLRADGLAARVLPGMKHSVPSIQEAVDQACEAGARSLVGLVMAPHFARMSVGAYERELRRAAGRHEGARVKMVQEWHLHPGLIESWAGPIRAIRRARPAFGAPDAAVLFSAHSLPATILAERDPYPEQLRETCRAIAAACGGIRWDFAWQSAGSRGPWLGPAVREVMEELHLDGVRSLLSAPIGFVTDHLEVLYDLDVETREAASKLGMAWARVPSPNTSPAFMDALRAVVRDALA